MANWWSHFSAIITVLILVDVARGLDRYDQCDDVVMSYTQMGYPSFDVPKQAVSAYNRPESISSLYSEGNDLHLCTGNVTCCSSDMEANLRKRSETEFSQRLVDNTDYSRSSFMTATANFNEFFVNLVTRSQTELHNMFSQAYGHLYQSNEAVFRKLYFDFNRYYTKGNVNLNDVMNQFFETVFKRMFILQNTEYDFDDFYLKCVTSKIKELKPFGEIPETLKKNIRQAFVAARTFVQGLAVGRNVAYKLAKVESSPECSYSVTKMSRCAMCQGMVTVKPCYGYCINVMRGCLAYHAELHTSWSNFIDALLELADRLEGGGSFNIEAVINPLKSMISTAVMEYHGSNKAINEKLFSLNVCGQPRPAGRRNKRRAKSKNKSRTKERLVLGSRDSNKKTTLSSLVREIKIKLRKQKNIWIELAETMCNGNSAALEDSVECWNGTEKAAYTTPLMKSGLSENLKNPEVDLSPTASNHLIQEQIQELEKATKHLNNAKLGINVDWLDLDAGYKDTSTSTSRPSSNGRANDIRLSGSASINIDSGSGTTLLPDDNEDSDADIEPEEVGSGILSSNNKHTTLPSKLSGSASNSNSGNGASQKLPDDEDNDVDVGSGSWSSNIVHITPPYKRKNKKQKLSGDKSRKNKGTIYFKSDDEDQSVGSGDKPYAIPILPSRPKKGKNSYTNGMHRPYVVHSGAGDDDLSASIDDTEYNTDLKANNPAFASDTQPQQKDDDEQPIVIWQWTTPGSSSATIRLHRYLLVASSFMLLICHLGDLL